MENKVIYLAGGCFWGVEAYYKKLKGVVDTIVGYGNGNTVSPKYEDLKKHLANHAETVKITYDINIISLEKILEHFLRIVDPYSVNHQGEDYGIQYRSAVFYENSEDEKKITNYFKSIDKNNRFVIIIEKLNNFYKAEEYHQDYLDNNPSGYCHIDFSKIKEEEKK